MMHACFYRTYMKNDWVVNQLLAVFMLVSPFFAQQTLSQDFSHTSGVWDAYWITVPDVSPDEYGVYIFRKDIELAVVPKSFPVHVSGDNRYKLYVNQKIVSIGPARSDVRHWNYETVDLAPYLQGGHNVIAAQVWNDGAYRPEANVSCRTGFILMGGSADAQVLNTDHTWKCTVNRAYSPKTYALARMTYMVAGPGETVDMHKYVHGWNAPVCDMTGWADARHIFRGIAHDMRGGSYADRWLLRPSPLPQMELAEEQPLHVRKATGVLLSGRWISGKTSLAVPPHTEADILLDQTYLTNAYFTLAFSGGDGSSIGVSYQESLYRDFPAKGNRNEVEGKALVGREDSILPDGRMNQEFTTLMWRTYRYVRLCIKTAAEPLLLNDVRGTFTGYPFRLRSEVKTGNKDIARLLSVGWRTARLCAIETYMDCPYYEQLQYWGDARIQALVTLYNSGDDRLVKNFLAQADISRIPEGITTSRYPESTLQLIPPYAISYICSLHDYMMYGRDQDFVRAKLMGVRAILDYFHRYQTREGAVRHLPFWNFTDWVYGRKGWYNGEAVPGSDGCSAVMDLQLLMGYQAAAHMEETLGMSALAELYAQRAEQLKQAVRKKYWDEKRGLFTDRIEYDAYSQHTNALAILTGTATDEQAREIALALQNDTTLAPASIYFKFFTHQAMVRGGLGDRYLHWLDKWKENIRMGLTTWAETSDVDNTRSDCHAWGASPNIEIFRTVLGIASDAPGFRQIRIEPHLGDLESIAGKMPHPDGAIAVSYNIKKGMLNADIDIPQTATGSFIWKGLTYKLNGGHNRIQVKP